MSVNRQKVIKAWAEKSLDPGVNSKEFSKSYLFTDTLEVAEINLTENADGDWDLSLDVDGTTIDFGTLRDETQLIGLLHLVERQTVKRENKYGI